MRPGSAAVSLLFVSLIAGCPEDDDPRQAAPTNTGDDGSGTASTGDDAVAVTGSSSEGGGTAHLDDSTGATGNDCCEPHSGPGCADPVIEMCVCENDAVCCTFDWDSGCVTTARSRCEVCGGEVHGSGTTAAGTSTGPEPGTSTGPEPGTTTGASATTGSTPGACCTVQATPGCADTAIETCVCDLDDYCCNTEWDGICVDEAASDCGADCEATADCCIPHDAVGCDDARVESCVCDLDDFCCSVEWDAQCVTEVEGEGCGQC